MEIKTCEEYVLCELHKTQAELDDCKAELEQTKKKLTEFKGDVDTYERLLDLIASHLVVKFNDEGQERIYVDGEDDSFFILNAYRNSGWIFKAKAGD